MDPHTPESSYEIGRSGPAAGRVDAPAHPRALERVEPLKSEEPQFGASSLGFKRGVLVRC